MKIAHPSAPPDTMMCIVMTMLRQEASATTVRLDTTIGYLESTLITDSDSHAGDSRLIVRLVNVPMQEQTPIRLR